MAIKIVDLPTKNGGSFHSYVNVYQRVKSFKIQVPSHGFHEMLMDVHWLNMNGM
jgi:hypothetical protein